MDVPTMGNSHCNRYVPMFVQLDSSSVRTPVCLSTARSCIMMAVTPPVPDAVVEG